MPVFFAVKAHGPDKDKLSSALAAGVVLAQQHSCQMTLLVPALKAAEGTILSDVLGEKSVRRLVKGETLRLEGCALVMCSMQTVNPFQEQGVVVALWGGKTMLEKLDKCSVAKAVVALSWLPEEIEPWIVARAATVL